MTDKIETLPELEDAHWIITKDYLFDADTDNMFKSSVGTRSREFPDIAPSTLPYQFRMLDDDGEVYYKGFSSCNSSFAPLDDYGMPDSGCTEIQYLENGEWVAL